MIKKFIWEYNKIITIKKGELLNNFFEDFLTGLFMGMTIFMIVYLTKCL